MKRSTLARELATIAAATLRRSRRAEVALRRGLEDLAVGLTSDEHRRLITDAIYGAAGRYHDTDRHEGLFSWEAEALEACFPRAPSRLLLGAAGGGREARALVTRGHDVLAFEPSEELLTRLHETPCASPSRLHAHPGCYEDLPRDTALRRVVEARAPYDGVIIGWGSLTHILYDRDVVSLLRVLLELAPGAPVLASCLHGAPPETSKARRRIRRLLTRLVRDPERFSEGTRFDGLIGFYRGYRREQIDRLARQAGYRIERFRDRDVYPHAVLVPA
jgi:hypothetical protein